MGTATTQAFAEFAARTDVSDIPDDVRTRVKRIMLDGIMCGLVGARLPWSARGVEALQALEGEGTATVWGWGQILPTSTAAMVNGSFVQAFELDDYHEHGPLHSASICLPTALATAERIDGVTGADLLAACTVGFEVGPRLGIAMGGYRMIERGWHCGAIYGTAAAAVTAARTRRLDAAATHEALGIAATQASGLMSAQFEAMVKRMHHGFAARAGTVAGGLAAHAYTGIKDVIERDYGGLIGTFSPDEQPDTDRLTGDLGERWELLNIAIKPFAAQGGLHPTIKAVLDLRAEHDLTPDDVTAITLRVGKGPWKHAGWTLTRPATEIGAQMNLAYGAAVALIDGEVGMAQFRADRLDGNDVWSVIDRVEVVYDADVDAQGRREQRPRLTKVEVATADGRTLRTEVKAAPGSGLAPLSNDDMRDKYYRLGVAVCPADRLERIETLVMSLEDHADLSELQALLAAPVSNPLAGD